MTTRRKNELGTILLYFSFSLAVLVGVTAIAVDLGRLFLEQRRIHYAADSAAIAAANKLNGLVADSTVDQEARAIGSLNGLASSEINVGGVQCGTWTGSNPMSGSFSPCCSGVSCSCSNCADQDANAVRVLTNRTFVTSFAKLLHVNTLSTQEFSIARAVRAPGFNCLVPFGVEVPSISGTQVGSTFTVGNNSPGNWGKLDVGGQMSSGSNFHDAMLNGICDASAIIGNSVSQGTGSGGSISNVFDDVLQYHKNMGMVIGVVTSFAQGNGNVTILNFAKVDFVSQTGNGNGWRGTFRLVEYPTIPPTGGNPAPPSQRFLVQ